MKLSATLRDYMGHSHVRDFLGSVVMAMGYTGALLIWALFLPFAVLVIPINRRIKGKRIARRWKARYGYTCPEKWHWWLKYM